MFLNVFVILPGINLQNHCVVAWFSLDDWFRQTSVLRGCSAAVPPADAPVRHRQKTMVTDLCYPAQISSLMDFGTPDCSLGKGREICSVAVVTAGSMSIDTRWWLKDTKRRALPSARHQNGGQEHENKQLTALSSLTGGPRSSIMAGERLVLPPWRVFSWQLLIYVESILGNFWMRYVELRPDISYFHQHSVRKPKASVSGGSC